MRKRSSRERWVASLLRKNGIHFESEWKFEDCKYKTHLRFDFYLPDFKCCIEYDGVHHYRPITKWVFNGYPISVDRAEREFALIKERDRIKNLYCKNNGIKLIRLNHYNYQALETILKEIKDEKRAENTEKEIKTL